MTQGQQTADLDTLVQEVHATNRLLRVLVLLQLANMRQLRPDVVGLLTNEVDLLVKQFGG